MSGILKCGWCQRQFVKSRDGARFCCTACHDRYHIDERRKALAAYRQMQGASLFFDGLQPSVDESDEDNNRERRRA